MAEKWLKPKYGIEIVAWVSKIGYLEYNIEDDLYLNKNIITRSNVDMTTTRCPNIDISNQTQQLVLDLKEKRNSVGGMVSCVCRNVPTGLGEPCFDKLDALLAHAMLSIPATKGFEIGSGFNSSTMLGSEHNDLFIWDKQKLGTQTNNSGGVQEEYQMVKISHLM